MSEPTGKYPPFSSPPAAPLPETPPRGLTPDDDELEAIFANLKRGHECVGFDCSLCEEFDNAIRDLFAQRAASAAPTATTPPRHLVIDTRLNDVEQTLAYVLGQMQKDWEDRTVIVREKDFNALVRAASRESLSGTPEQET